MFIIEAIHGMAATAWVGGIFFAYMALRPAAIATLEPLQRVELWRSAYKHFFPWVWLCIGILLVTGYTDLFSRLGGFSNKSIYLWLMHGIGLLMVIFFAYLYFGLYMPLSKTVKNNETKNAAEILMKMRPVMAINLTLGMCITAIGIAGPSL